MCRASRLEETGRGDIVRLMEVVGSGGNFKRSRSSPAPKLCKLPSNKRVVVRRHRFQKD